MPLSLHKNKSSTEVHYMQLYYITSYYQFQLILPYNQISFPDYSRTCLTYS